MELIKKFFLRKLNKPKLTFNNFKQIAWNIKKIVNFFNLLII